MEKRKPSTTTVMVDGEMQADTAIVRELIEEHYPFSLLNSPANVLIFPDLQSANIGYKLVQRLGNAEAIGPILVGMRKPVHVLQYGFETKDVVNMAAIAAVDALELSQSRKAEPGGHKGASQSPGRKITDKNFLCLGV